MKCLQGSLVKASFNDFMFSRKIIPIGVCYFLSHINHSPALRVYLYGKMQCCAETVTETSIVPLGGQSTCLIVRAYLCTHGQN